MTTAYYDSDSDRDGKGSLKRISVKCINYQLQMHDVNRRCIFFFFLFTLVYKFALIS
jgi:hypothetical protein